MLTIATKEDIDHLQKQIDYLMGLKGKTKNKYTPRNQSVRALKASQGAVSGGLSAFVKEGKAEKVGMSLYKLTGVK